MQPSLGSSKSIKLMEEFILIRNIPKNKKSDQSDCFQFKKCLKSHMSEYCHLKFDPNYLCYAKK